jgi:hypothetical protein
MAHERRSLGLTTRLSAQNRGGPHIPDDLVAPPVPTTREMMLMAGNKPHQTLLHDTILEDFGLDVLAVIRLPQL